MGVDETWRGWRTCEFCGCYTNAKARACCERGRDADVAPTPPEDASCGCWPSHEPTCHAVGGATPPEDDASLDSPPYTPAALTEFAARGYERVNRPAEDDAARVAREWCEQHADEDPRYLGWLVDDAAKDLATLLRAAERRGYERGLSEGAAYLEAEGRRSTVNADAIYARRGAELLRALRERAGGGR